MKRRGPPAALAGANAPRLIAFRPRCAAPGKGAAAVDEMDDSSPEVTISPADNGHVVRWHQRGDGKKTEGRTIKRVAMSSDDALGHAAEALGGGGKTSKKKSSRDGQSALADSGDDGGSAVTPGAHAMRTRSRSSARRRPVRSRRRV